MIVDKLVVEDINIEVIKKNIKNINLSVQPPCGRVRVSTPKNMSDKSIKDFLISKISWIKKQRKKFKNQVIETPREFVSGENHYFLGERYLLDVIETKSKQRVEVANNKHLNLHVRKDSTREKREKVMIEWYRSELKKMIPKYIKKWEKVMDVEVNDWNVRKMKTIWGSCHIQNKKIILNIQLAKKNLRCLEYVVVHEMVHLLERKHNDRFKSYMDRFLPNWRAIQKEVNGIA